MIQYALKCSQGHTFDSWFQSAEAYDKLAGSNMVTCVVCGTTCVEKAIMTPRVRPARDANPKTTDSQPQAKEVVAATPSPEVKKAMAELRRKIEDTSDYVGKDFAREARRIHLGEAPDRAIYGEAKAEEAKSLIEDGVPVAPLPFLPTRKTN